MPMMVAVPTMPMVVMVAHFDHNLRTRFWRQRHEEHQGKNSKCKLLYAHGNNLFLFHQTI
jgi:hypothetical protein